ncbi:MAG TPA: alpha/beta fold hydrolase [Pseudonocardiaceae bacterium]|jgi:pimeloyl-ACP methyl ester carboxylesterase|nr:alpha/beta fold hydrolase [Pseudonocardiaceae bacterium]
MELMVDVAGGSVWVEDRGGDGTPVLMLHPNWGDSTIWAPVIDLLPASVRVIRFDARGYGRSPSATGPFTQVGDAIGILDRLAVSAAIVVGHSGGGATALSLALSRPDAVRALVLVAPGVDGYPWPADPYGAEFMVLFRANDRDGLVALGLRTWAAADPGKAAEVQIRGAVDAMFRQGSHEQDGPPVFDRLSQLHVPTRLVVGDRDQPTVIDCVTAVAARIPGSRLTVLPGVDHLVPLRAPQLLVDMINSECDRDS